MDIAIIWQRVEGAVVFLSALAIYSFLGAEFSWWLTIFIFLTPDISFAAYLLGPKAGAAGYNTVHVYAFGACILAVGLTLNVVMISSLGALWLAHSGFDRMLGYGLKSPDGFNITHLGKIGRSTPK